MPAKKPKKDILKKLGKDATPTKEMVVKGSVGNGINKNLDEQFAETLQRERSLLKQEAKVERIKGYEEGVKDALGSVAKFEKTILAIGNALLEKVQMGDVLTPAEVQTLKLAQSNNDGIKAYALGKPKTTTEINQNVSILGLFAGAPLDLDADE